MRVEEHRFVDANFAGEEIVLNGQFFAVGSSGLTLLRSGDFRATQKNLADNS